MPRNKDSHTVIHLEVLNLYKPSPPPFFWRCWGITRCFCLARVELLPPYHKSFLLAVVPKQMKATQTTVLVLCLQMQMGLDSPANSIPTLGESRVVAGGTI